MRPLRLKTQDVRRSIEQRIVSKVFTPERLSQVFLGIVLAVAAMVPLGLALVAPFVWSRASDWRWAALGSFVSAAAFVWCARTAWRLITGRSRRDGGLLSPWFITAAGVVAAVGVVFGLSQFGLAWIGGALYLGSISVGCLELARRRFRQRAR